MLYTKQQKQLITYSRQKIESAFALRQSRAHGIDHVARVARWAREIARAQKLELLYCVRYHWNDEANKYDTAWILRDADKLDCYGEIGVKRLRAAFGYGTEEWNLAMRCMFATTIRLRTRTACQIVKTRHILVPMEKELKKFLKNKIEKVEL